MAFTAVDQLKASNPDGDNGPRDNGAPDTGVTYNAQFDVSGKNVITYYFAKTGDLFIDENLTTPGSTDTMIAKGFEQWEKDAFRTALDSIPGIIGGASALAHSGCSARYLAHSAIEFQAVTERLWTIARQHVLGLPLLSLRKY